MASAAAAVELFELDDKFNADEFARQFEVAMQRKPVALLTPIGSAALNKLVNDKLLDKHPVAIINAIPGAEPFRKPGHPRLFHVRASDRQQLEKIVRARAHAGCEARLGRAATRTCPSATPA